MKALFGQPPAVKRLMNCYPTYSRVLCPI